MMESIKLLPILLLTSSMKYQNQLSYLFQVFAFILFIYLINHSFLADILGREGGPTSVL